MKPYKPDELTTLCVTMKTRKMVNALRDDANRKTADAVILEMYRALKEKETPHRGKGE